MSPGGLGRWLPYLFFGHIGLRSRQSARSIGADVLPDGMSVKVNDGTVYEPDAIR